MALRQTVVIAAAAMLTSALLIVPTSGVVAQGLSTAPAIVASR